MPSFWRNFLCGSAQPAPSAPPAHLQNNYQYPDQPNQQNQRNVPTAGRSNAVAGARRPERMHDAVRTSRNAGAVNNTVDFDVLLPELVAQHCTNTYNNLIRGGLNARDTSGRTLAEAALQSGRHDAAEIIAALRSEHADFQLPDRDGNQLLHRAIMAGNLQGVQILLANGIDPNSMNTRTLPNLARYSPLPQVGATMNGLYWHWDDGDRASALHLAAAFGDNPALVKALVAAGANVHLINAHGYTPLHWAASFASNPDIIDALVECGANISATTTLNCTPLHTAAGRNPSLAIIDRLIRHGADLDALNGDRGAPLAEACLNPAQSEVVRALIHHGANATGLQRDEKSPLAVAGTFSQSLEIAHNLRLGGLDLAAEGIEQRMIDCINAGYFSNAQVLHALIDGGATNVLDLGNCPSSQEMQFMMLKLKVLNIMLESSAAAVHIIGNWNRTARDSSLTYTALRHQISPPLADESVRILSTWRDCQPGTNFTRLMRNRGDINKRDADGKTLVEVALETNQDQAAVMVTALKAAGADLELPDANQNRLLHRLILANNVAGARILIANHVNLNAMNQCTGQVVAQYTDALRAAGVARPINWTWSAGDTATPLHLASAFSNDPALISALIAAGAGVDQANRNLATPLHWACTFAKEAHVIDALIAGGANRSIETPGLGTPVECAAGGNPNINIVRTLITHGAEIERIGNRGCAPLHWAAISPSQARVVRALIELGANRLMMSTNQNNNQDSPLQLAVTISTRIEIAKILADGGMDLSAIDCRQIERQSVVAGYADMTEVIQALYDGITHQSTQIDADIARAFRQVEADIGVGARLTLRADNSAADQLVRSQLNVRTSRTLAALRGLQAAQRALPVSVQLRPAAAGSAPPRAPRATITDLDEMERLDFAFAQSLQLEEDEHARHLAAARGWARRGPLRPSTPHALDRPRILQSDHVAATHAQLPPLVFNSRYFAVPLVQAVEQWYPSSRGDAVSTEQAQRVAAWHAIGAEEHAEAFRTFLLKLPETADYVSEPCRPAFMQRIQQLLDVLQTTPALRTKAFELVFEAASSCGDRVALALNNIEIARINYNAEQGHTTAEELITLRTGMFRLRVLEELAHQKIAALRNQTEDILDEVEVVLGFQVLLAAEMDLPAVSRSMRYQRSSNITPADLQHAREQVALREQRNEFVKFIAEWQPWQNQLQRLRPNDFAELDRRVADERARLAEQPGYTSDNDYVELCRQMEAMQRTRQTFSLENWTREWLVQNRSGAA